MVRVHPFDPAASDPHPQAAGRARGEPVAPNAGRPLVPRPLVPRPLVPPRSLVLGGTRSGKSRHAEDLLPADAPVRYAATARRHADDAEWAARIDAHRARRPAAWTTLEEPDLPALLRALGPDGPPLLVDDLATWLTGVLDDAGAWEAPTVPDAVGARVAELVDAVAGCRGRVVLVSAEVGLGVVPATRAGRLFRDELGALNAALAAACDEVLLLVAGLALRLK